MKLVVTVLVGVALGVVTNLVAKFLEQPADRNQRLIWALFAALTSSTLVLALLPDSNDSTQPRSSFALSILEPKKDTEVGQYVKARGNSSFHGEMHYLVATPENKQVRYVASSVFFPDSDGRWEGAVRLGSGSEGLGQTFEIQVLAAKAAIPQGVLTQNPEGAHVSSAVVVKRTK
jgi:hypothetical protein